MGVHLERYSAGDQRCAGSQFLFDRWRTLLRLEYKPDARAKDEVTLAQSSFACASGLYGMVRPRLALVVRSLPGFFAPCARTRPAPRRDYATRAIRSSPHGMRVRRPTTSIL